MPQASLAAKASPKCDNLEVKCIKMLLVAGLRLDPLGGCLSVPQTSSRSKREGRETGKGEKKRNGKGKCKGGFACAN